MTPRAPSSRSRPARATEQKPYRVYRSRSRRPTRGRSGLEALQREPVAEPAAAAAVKPTRTRQRRRLRRRPLAVVLGLLLLLVLAATAWGALGYMAVSSGVAAANKRLPASARAALSAPAPSLLSNPTDVLLLGTDHSDAASRSFDDHSDSIMLLRVDPGHHRLVFLSIPRDLLAPIPGYGTAKINTAMQVGGPALAIKTVRAFTGLRVDHVALVDFTSFLQLVDSVGGVTVDVPEAIVSDKFDCPYSEARCASWKGWRFAKGPQRMDARQALVYSRIRVNELNPADSDLTRALHQQQIIQAVVGKLAGVGTLLRLPFDGGSLLKPLSTDLSATDFLELGWLKFRSSTTLHCRLGGSPDGRGNLIPSPANAAVLQEVVGRRRPAPPGRSAGMYAPGCTTGNQAFPS